MYFKPLFLLIFIIFSETEPISQKSDNSCHIDQTESKIVAKKINFSDIKIVSDFSFDEKQELPSDSILRRNLEEMVISAQRVPVTFSDANRSIKMIHKEQIAALASQDLSGVLSTVRSVDIRNRGTFGMQSDVSIRGGTFDQSLLLLNGIPINDPQTGHHNLNIPIGLQSIERIEVLHGPGARVFGPNAFNGAIHIITKKPGDPHLNVSLTGGSHQYTSAELSAGFRSGSVSHHLSLKRMSSDGFTSNTDFKSGTLFLHSQTGFLGGTLGLQTGYEAKAFGANSFYSPRFPDQFEETRTGFASLRWFSKAPGRFTPKIYWRRHYDRFELFRHDTPEWYEGHNYHRNDVAGASLSAFHESSYGITAIGLDFRYEHIYSTVLGELMSSPVPIPGYIEKEGDLFYTHSHARKGGSLMFEHSITLRDFSVSGGSLLYSNSDIDAPVTFFPGIDAGWQLSKAFRIYFSANRSLRLPTFTDLYYEGPDNIGNPQLKPERSVTLETGMKASWQRFQMDTALFQRRGTHMIDWTRRPGEEFWRSENLTNVVLTGFETGFSFSPIAGRLFSGFSRSTISPRNGIEKYRAGNESQISPSFRQAKEKKENFSRSQPLLVTLNYTYIHADRNSGSFISNYALDHLKHKMDLVLYLPLGIRTGMNVHLSWQERAGSYMLFSDGRFTEMRPFDPFWLTNIKGWVQNRTFRLFAEATNLFNTPYHDIANVPQPGRWIRLGILYRSPK